MAFEPLNATNFDGLPRGVIYFQNKGHWKSKGQSLYQIWRSLSQLVFKRVEPPVGRLCSTPERLHAAGYGGGQLVKGDAAAARPTEKSAKELALTSSGIRWEWLLCRVNDCWNCSWVGWKDTQAKVFQWRLKWKISALHSAVSRRGK